MKKIGYTQAFKAISIGLGIAYVIMALMAGALWIFEVNYSSAIFLAVSAAYGGGYFFGGLAGLLILRHKFPSILVGIFTGFAIIWCATLVGSQVAFITEGLQNQDTIMQSANDYILKPLFMVTVFGFIPIIFVGIWFGTSVEKYQLGNKNSGCLMTKNV